MSHFVVSRRRKLSAGELPFSCNSRRREGAYRAPGARDLAGGSGGAVKSWSYTRMRLDRAVAKAATAAV